VNELARIFQTNATTVRRTLLPGPEDLAILGRHAVLDNESETVIIALVLEWFQTAKLLTRKQLLDIVHKDDNPRFTKEWLNAILGRHIDEMKVCRSLPQEDARLAIPRAYLEVHIAFIRTCLRAM
jgi:hypothetical protein